MKSSRAVQVCIATTIGAAITVGSALGGSEPKNEPPFTRSVYGSQTVYVAKHAVTRSVTGGESKNQSPFTTDIGGGNSPTARAFGGQH